MKKPGKVPKKADGKLISAAELGRRKGVSRSAVSQALRDRLRAARRGSKVDVTHPEVVAWLHEEARGPAAAPRVAPKATPDDDLPLLSLRKKRAEVAKLEQRVERDRGRLVSRELVRLLVVGHVEELHARLLREGATALAGLCLSAARAGETRESLVPRIRERLSQDIDHARRAVIGGLAAAATRSATGVPPAVHESDARALDSRIASARRAALATARAEVIATIPDVTRAAGQHAQRGADSAELEPVIRAMLGAAFDRVGRVRTQTQSDNAL